MTNNPSTLQGLWLPLVTPFIDGMLDEASLRRMVVHYAGEPIDGLILAATTGEEPSLEEEEIERLVAVVTGALAAAGRRLPIYLGLSGSDTRKLIKALDRTADWPIDGHLISCPSYSRPSQEGMFQHFTALAASTDRPIILYNIPYRTGVNLNAETTLRLAAQANIVGLKDCAVDPAQSFDLLRFRPPGFSVLTGEDAGYYNALALGAEGGITASAHVAPRAFAGIRQKLLAGDRAGALADWRAIADLPRLLFAEPSPAPIKHWLWRVGLIDSPELRLPMTPVTDALAARIDQEIERRRG